MCTWCLRLVLYSGDSVEGVCPRVCSLSSLYKEPVCSPWWHLTQCLSSSPVSRALCPATRPVNAHTLTHTHTVHTWQSHMRFTSLASTGLWHTLMSTHTHPRHQHPGKADLSLSWITDIHTALCSQNNLIPLTPSLRVYSKAYVCVRFLSDSVWLIRGWNPQQVSSTRSHVLELQREFVSLWRRKRRREVKEKSPSAQVAVITHELFIGCELIHTAFTGF